MVQAGGAATQPAAGEGGAAAGAAPAKAPPAWKALDKQVQQQVYLFLKERLEVRRQRGCAEQQGAWAKAALVRRALWCTPSPACCVPGPASTSERFTVPEG